jgi:hypothetical protein
MIRKNALFVRTLAVATPLLLATSLVAQDAAAGGAEPRSAIATSSPTRTAVSSAT